MFLSPMLKKQQNLIPALPFSRNSIKAGKPLGNKYMEVPNTIGITCEMVDWNHDLQMGSGGANWDDRRTYVTLEGWRDIS